MIPESEIWNFDFKVCSIINYLPSTFAWTQYIMLRLQLTGIALCNVIFNLFSATNYGFHHILWPHSARPNSVFWEGKAVASVWLSGDLMKESVEDDSKERTLKANPMCREGIKVFIDRSIDFIIKEDLLFENSAPRQTGLKSEWIY